MVPLASRKEPPLLAASQTVLFSWSEMTGFTVGNVSGTSTSTEADGHPVSSSITVRMYVPPGTPVVETAPSLLRMASLSITVAGSASVVHSYR